MKIGVISDTHNFFDPRISSLFDGVQHILHAGDIGSPAILQRLRKIAPVTAVSGNTDDEAHRYEETQVVELADRRFLLHHIVDPRFPSDKVRALVLRDRPSVLVFGHTHKPFCETIGEVLYFNPGYAGQTRFGMPRTMAILHCADGALRPEYLAL